MKHISIAIGIGLLALALAGVFIVPAQAQPSATITVDTKLDDLTINGNCTLREAIVAANTDTATDACPAGNGADTILFASNVTGTIDISPVSQPLPSITDSVSIIGPGANVLTVYLARNGNVLSMGATGKAFSVSGLALTGLGSASTGLNLGGGTHLIEAMRINNNWNGGLSVNPAAVVTVRQSTLSNNSRSNAGGGIYNFGGTLYIYQSTISDNFASFGGGGIYNSSYLTNTGTIFIFESTLLNNSSGSYIALGGGALNNAGGVMTLVNSTVSGNSAPSIASNMGGGIYNTGAFTITSSTIVSNSTTGLGGGVYFSGTVKIQNSIIANSPTGGDCAFGGGTLIDGGHNLIEDNTCGFTGGADPLVGPLQDNGGPTLTHALLPGSPAIDAGDPAGCKDALGNLLVGDQRGFIRAADGDSNGSVLCDIGAFEYNATALLQLFLPLILR